MLWYRLEFLYRKDVEKNDFDYWHAIEQMSLKKLCFRLQAPLLLFSLMLREDGLNEKRLFKACNYILLAAARERR